MTREEFERLYREHAGAVLAYARRRTTREAADDVVADVFMVAWRRVDDVPKEPLPWLLAVARKVLANQRRGEHRGAALRERIRGQQVWVGSPVVIRRIAVGKTGTIAFLITVYFFVEPRHRKITPATESSRDCTAPACNWTSPRRPSRWWRRV